MENNSNNLSIISRKSPYIRTVLDPRSGIISSKPDEYLLKMKLKSILHSSTFPLNSFDNKPNTNTQTCIFLIGTATTGSQVAWVYQYPDDKPGPFDPANFRYLGAVEGDQDLSLDWYASRLVSRIIQIRANTISTTNVALGGTINAITIDGNYSDLAKFFNEQAGKSLSQVFSSITGLHDNKLDKASGIKSWDGVTFISLPNKFGDPYVSTDFKDPCSQLNVDPGVATGNNYVSSNNEGLKSYTDKIDVVDGQWKLTAQANSIATSINVEIQITNLRPDKTWTQDVTVTAMGPFNNACAVVNTFLSSTGLETATASVEIPYEGEPVAYVMVYSDGVGVPTKVQVVVTTPNAASTNIMMPLGVAMISGVPQGNQITVSGTSNYECLPNRVTVRNTTLDYPKCDLHEMDYVRMLLSHRNQLDLRSTMSTQFYESRLPAWIAFEDLTPKRTEADAFDWGGLLKIIKGIAVPALTALAPQFAPAIQLGSNAFDAIMGQSMDGDEIKKYNCGKCTDNNCEDCKIRITLDSMREPEDKGCKYCKCNPCKVDCHVLTDGKDVAFCADDKIEEDNATEMTTMNDKDHESIKNEAVTPKRADEKIITPEELQVLLANNLQLGAGASMARFDIKMSDIEETVTNRYKAANRYSINNAGIWTVTITRKGQRSFTYRGLDRPTGIITRNHIIDLLPHQGLITKATETKLQDIGTAKDPLYKVETTAHAMNCDATYSDDWYDALNDTSMKLVVDGLDGNPRCAAMFPVVIMENNIPTRYRMYAAVQGDHSKMIEHDGVPVVSRGIGKIIGTNTPYPASLKNTITLLPLNRVDGNVLSIGHGPVCTGTSYHLAAYMVDNSDKVGLFDRAFTGGIMRDPQGDLIVMSNPVYEGKKRFCESNNVNLMGVPIGNNRTVTPHYVIRMNTDMNGLSKDFKFIPCTEQRVGVYANCMDSVAGMTGVDDLLKLVGVTEAVKTGEATGIDPTEEILAELDDVLETKIGDMQTELSEIQRMVQSLKANRKIKTQYFTPTQAVYNKAPGAGKITNNPQDQSKLETINQWLEVHGMVDTMFEVIKRDPNNNRLHRILYPLIENLAEGNSYTPSLAIESRVSGTAMNLARQYPGITTDWIIANGNRGPNPEQAQYFKRTGMLPAVGVMKEIRIKEKKPAQPPQMKKEVDFEAKIRNLKANDSQWTDRDTKGVRDYIEEYGEMPDTEELNKIKAYRLKSRKKPLLSTSKVRFREEDY